MVNAFKKFGVFLACLTLILGLSNTYSGQLFKDLKTSHWCYEKIMDFVDKGYIDGYEDGTMRPDKTITRAEYVKVVNNFFGYEVSATSKKFSDVTDNAWYAKYVYTAVANGYIEGFEDGTFRPENPITRQEATVILSRILEIDEEVYPKDHKDGLMQYSDGYEVASWAYTPIHSYSVYNFINGYEDGSLRILQNVTRAETVELLNILAQNIEKDDDNKWHTKLTAQKPIIDVLKVSDNSNYIKASKTDSGWFNKESTSIIENKNAVVVNITSKTTDSTIHEILDTRSGERNYKTTTPNVYTNKFLLTDGVYNVLAYASKFGYKNSEKVESQIKVDTVSPEVNGTYIETTTSSSIKRERFIEIKIIDPRLSNVNEISGLDESKLRYAWFKKSGDEYLRYDNWNLIKLSGNKEIIAAPTSYGEYKLGVSAFDIAENTFGTLEDIYLAQSGEEKIPFDFVEEFENDEDIIIIIGEIEGTLNSTNTNILKAEPNSKIEYDLKIKNKEKNEENVKISFNRPVVVTIDKVAYILASGEILNKKINIPGDSSVTIKVSTIVPSDFPIADIDFDLTSNIGLLSGDEIVETKQCDEYDIVEKTVIVATQEPKDKNIVIVIDVSGSMLFCTEHTHYEGTGEGLPYRFNNDFVKPEAFPGMVAIPSGDYIYTGYPLLGHQYFDEVSASWKTCNVDETRIEVAKKALHDFADILAKAAKTNGENISFTIATFSGDASTGSTYVFEKNDNMLQTVYNEINKKTTILRDGGTNIEAGVNTGIAAFSNVNMLNNADNYFILFGDGKPTTGATISDEFNNVIGEVIDYAYAIGFGEAFRDKESEPYKVLQKIAGVGNVTHAADANAVLDEFSKIAKTIASSKQSENGKIIVNLPADKNYYPIYFTHLSGDETVNLYNPVVNLEDLSNLEDVKIENNKLIWDISGKLYSTFKDLKVQLTIKD